MLKGKIISGAVFLFLIFISIVQTSYAQISAPHNLQSSVKENTVTINWIEPESRNAVSYNIYRYIAADTSGNADVTHFNFSKVNSTASPIYQDTITTPADSITGAQPVAVFYYVTAVNDSGQESVPSQILRVVVITPGGQIK